MRTIDTNILVYAHREEFPQHPRALAILDEFALGQEPWALLWPCLYEFVRVVTHPRLFRPPTPLELAADAVERLIERATVVLPSEGKRHGSWFRRMLLMGGCTGNLVHDAHIAALMREHGIDEIVTGDKDFLRFEGIRVRDPFQV